MAGEGEVASSEKSGCACGTPGAVSDPCPGCMKVLAAASGAAPPLGESPPNETARPAPAGLTVSSPSGSGGAGGGHAGGARAVVVGADRRAGANGFGRRRHGQPGLRRLRRRRGATRRDASRRGPAAWRGTPAITPGVAAAVGAIGGGGEPLPSKERRFFEERFGRDLSSVRVHANRPAAEAARALRAEAFTLGGDVAFGEGRYQPGSDAGRHLLAHELAHVIQQGAAAPLPGEPAPAPVTAAAGGARIARQVDESVGAMEEVGPMPMSMPMAAASPGTAPVMSRVPSGRGARWAEWSRTTRDADQRPDAQVGFSGAAPRRGVRGRQSGAGAGRARHEGLPAGRAAAVSLRAQAGRPPGAPAIRKFVPGANATMTARGYIPLVAARMARGVRTWVETGRIQSDIPDEVRANVPWSAEGGVGAAIAGAIGGAVSSVVGAVGGALSAIGGLFFKEAAWGSAAAAVPTRRRCPRGSARGVRSRARRGRAWRARSDGARWRTPSRRRGRRRPGAQSRRARLHARRAHHLGEGNYRPGTPVGDALLAHELAHVGQQRGAGGIFAPRRALSKAPSNGTRTMRRRRRWQHCMRREPGGPGHRPRLQSGLRLSRCASAGPGRAAAPAMPATREFTAFKQRLSNLAISTTTLASEVSALSNADRDEASKDLSGERIRLQREIASSRRRDRRRAGRSDEDRA